MKIVYCFDKTLEDNKIIEALVACEPDILQVFSVTSHTLDDEQRVLGQISDIYNRELVGIIGWAKQILGFSSLALNDQMRLLQSTWVKIILTFSLAWKSMPHTGRYRFTQDITLDERLARESHCTDLYTHCIQIVDRVEKLDWVSVVRPDQAMRATPNMVFILPGLRQTDGIVRKLWSSVYRTGKVPKNKLFVEMLEAAGYRTQHDPNFQCSMVDDDFSVGLINNYVSFGSDDENSNPKLT
ncbi:hypothetical protein PV325_010095, partial [Microctonus aethiopoides]